MEANWQQNENEIVNENEIENENDMIVPLNEYHMEKNAYASDEDRQHSNNLTLLKPQNGVRKTSMNPNRIYRCNAPQNNEREMSLPLDIGKSIRLMRNGDPFYRGHKFVISTRKYRYFDVFMDHISDTLNFGAIRKIYNLEGQRLLNLEELKDGEIYVAAGIEKFIKMNYTEISEGKRQPPLRLPSLVRDYPVSQYEGNQSLLINVFKNGDSLTSAFKILLYKNSMVSFDAVLNEISSKIKLLNGPILKIYKLDGELVFQPHKIEHGHSYVAAGRERYRNVDYNTSNESVKNSISKSTSRDLPPVKVQKQNQQFKIQHQSPVKKTNQKTKVDFNKPQTDNIFDHKTPNDTLANDSGFSGNIGEQTQGLDTESDNGHQSTENMNNENNKIQEISFKEMEEKELQQSYQKLSDNDFSEITSQSNISE